MEKTELMQAETEAGLQARPIEVITAEICFYKQQACASFIEIGRRLIEAKEQLSHGEWLPWLEEKVEFSAVMAQRFMRLAREYSNASPVTHLGASKALALLALPDSEREEFVAEKHSVNGEEKTVEEMSKRELEQAIRERDAANRRASEAEDELKEMERAVENSEGRIREYEEKLERAEEDAERAEVELRNLRAQLEDMREKVTEVAVETVIDQETVAAAEMAAKKETEEKLRKEIEKAKKDKETAEKARSKAAQDLAALKMEQENAAKVAEREKKELSEQVQTLKKKLAIASSSETAIFKVHFEQAQNSINKMAECIKKMKDAGSMDDAEKMKTAFFALMNAGKGVL